MVKEVLGSTSYFTRYKHERIAFLNLINCIYSWFDSKELILNIPSHVLPKYPISFSTRWNLSEPSDHITLPKILSLGSSSIKWNTKFHYKFFSSLIENNIFTRDLQIWVLNISLKLLFQAMPLNFPSRWICTASSIPGGWGCVRVRGLSRGASSASSLSQWWSNCRRVCPWCRVLLRRPLTSRDTLCRWAVIIGARGVTGAEGCRNLQRDSHTSRARGMTQKPALCHPLSYVDQWIDGQTIDLGCLEYFVYTKKYLTYIHSKRSIWN